jgi:response regulator RpfG family c-di-GMP phosphodiesterase
MDALNNLRKSANAKGRMPSDVPRHRILIVDDEPSVCTLLIEGLSPQGFECRAVTGGDEAIRALELERFDALICDLRLPGVSGLSVLETARAKYPWMSTLIATGVDNVRVGVEAMKLGADDYLVKPFQLEAVVTAVERAIKKKRLEWDVENYREHLEEMVKERTEQLRAAIERDEATYDETMQTLGAAMGLRHTGIEAHARRVTLYCREIAKAMGYSPEQTQQLLRGAYLHDIGKIAIPDAILLKPDTLTPDEVAVMQTHARRGCELLCHMPFLKFAAEIVLAHHERFDGAGYPQGLKGEDIPLGARIVAVAEAFDVMACDQPYKGARTVEDALAEIRRCSGTQFDPKVVKAFLDWVQIHGDPRQP